ncbi:ABC transporter substrate-binding protein [Streptomyces sp. NPDC008092]|uniref:ABC transporter substrate-binding protein n=1 Tax=Streptomyces sp. NPDC008092 TaxID=3364808 RepID=UPI0036EA4A6B
MSVEKFSRRPARVVAGACTALVLTLVAACAGNGDAGANSKSDKADSARQVELPVKKAQGKPIVVGMINNDTNAAGNFANMGQATRAAVKYVNNNLGGAGGRPIRLEYCNSNGTTAASANCAAQILEQKPAAVIGGLDLGSDGSLPVLAKAGVPYVATTPISATELTSPDSFSFFAGAAGSQIAASVYAAKELHTKKAAVLFNENPQARLAAERFVRDVLKAQGVKKVTMVPFGVNETDVAGPLSQALQGGTDTVFGIMPEPGCVNVLKAKQSLASTATYVFTGNCAAPGVLKAGGSAADGSYFPVSVQPADADTPDTKAFRAAIAKYAPSVDLGFYPESAFAATVSLSRVLGRTAKPDDPAAVIKAFHALKNEPTFVGPPVTCDGKQVAGLPSVCTNQVRIVKSENGRLQDVAGRWYSG